MYEVLSLNYSNFNDLRIYENFKIRSSKNCMNIYRVFLKYLMNNTRN